MGPKVEAALKTLVERQPENDWACRQLVRVAGIRAGDALCLALRASYQRYGNRPGQRATYLHRREQCVGYLARIGDARSVTLGLEAISERIKTNGGFGMQSLVSALSEGLMKCGPKISLESLLQIWNLPATIRGLHTEDYGDTTVEDSTSTGELKNLAASVAKQLGIDLAEEQERESRALVMESRRRRRQCVLCEEPLGFWDRWRKREQHDSCTTFRK
jgi:hypothetical protein